MRKFQIFLIFILIVSPILSACGASRPSAVVRVGWAGEPDTFNPGMALLSESYSIFSMIYDTLYEYDLNGTYRLSLAESVDVSADNKVWTFKIREGVKFHDGEPLTAEDVAFSFNFYKAHTDDFVFLPAYTTYFDSVKATPDNKVVITLTQAIPNMESQLFGLYVLPKHIWEKVQDPKATAIPLEQSVGSGPFKLVEYVPGSLIRLEAVRNHYYYHPHIAEVDFLIYADTSSMVQALQNKQIDVIAEVPVSAVLALNDLPGVRVVAGPPVAPNVSDILIDQIAPENCPVDVGGVCKGHPALRDRNVRLALAYATDKQRLVDQVLFGLADPGLTLIPKGLGAFYNSSIKDYPFDVAKANQILDEAGYLDTNSDGVREMPGGGTPLSFRVQWPDNNSYAANEAELLKVMWSQIGINIQMQGVNPDHLTDLCCPAFDYDIILWEWGSDPDPNFLLSVMRTDEILSGYNETGYSNPEYDKLYDKQAVEMDKETRLKLIWQMQDMVHTDVVYIVPFYQRTVQAYRTDTFRGWLTESGNLDLDAISSLAVIEPITQ
jgi:peptide/nickel transport system substrate-binding protein